MALRDQPYLPLYIQDYLTDEKLNECSASTQGIYIKIMCLMHKSETYGKILLKQKYKLNNNYALDLAMQLAKHLPFSEPELVNAITELVDEKVCYIDGNYICQKRMIRDNNLSIQRAEAGKKGGEKTQKKNKKFAKAKDKANSESEYEYEYEDINENIDIIYNRYPSKCVVKNSSTGKSSKTNKAKIRILLSTHTKDELINIIDWYIDECKTSKVYMKNFSTFLNNLPDISHNSLEDEDSSLNGMVF